ncbi:glycan-binding surface protein [Hymenobacter tibetensis]|uniref:Glycan-binding surface protein n=1 Tax=Hymenobacter tibetensis TaxID=497967 RepID=A0ABY4CUP9_9BACT|nr:glycan-binding surface protein [Hymenobacter tibetensis]UOG74000.1 glycan-binding surface protein [Hymenobacter tibetensis]
MKLYSTFNHALVAGLLLGAFAFSACEKEDAPACSGAPSVERISTPTNRTEGLTNGKLADWVIIQGSNFCGVSQVLFNDVEADLKDAYITPTEITLRIPRVVPKNVSNMVTIVSDAGSTETAYTLSIPSLEVAGMSNEYTPAGQRMAVVGKNFDLYGISVTSGKVLWNGTPLTVTRATSDSLYFTVPANATPGATLKVIDANNVEKAVPGRYKDDRNIVFGYDQGGSIWGGNTYITQGPIPAPINGSFIRVITTVNEWVWTEFSTSNQLTLPNAVVANPSGYVLRFEMNTLKPFSTSGIKFVIDGDANTYTWTPAVPFNTRGQWSTRTVNLTDIVKNPLEPTRTLHEFKFVFHGPGTLDADIAFDNFRIVPKD